MKATLKLENGKEVDLTDEQIKSLGQTLNVDLTPKDYIWKPSLGETYWFVDNDGEAMTSPYDNDTVDMSRFRLGNVFKTKKEAEKAVQWLKAFKVLRYDAGRFNSRVEHVVGYNSLTNELQEESSTFTRHLLPFNSVVEAENSIRRHSKEWRIILGVDDE